MNAIYEDIARRINLVLGDYKKPAVLHAPFMNGNEQKYVAQTIEENWVSSAGAFVSRFEKELAAYCGVKNAVAVVNGTVALHVCMHVLGIGQGDEVLVPSATFAATGNAIFHAGAIPHLIECEDRTVGVDPALLKTYLQNNTRRENGATINKNTGRPIKAIIPVHIFGVPADIDKITEVAEEFGLIVIQDNAEVLGATFKGGSPFKYGRCAALSFNGNKIITAGGGGAILTDDDALAKKIRHVTTTAKLPHAFAFFHDEVGFNYRMPNLNAALVCAQLEQMDDFLRRKKILAERYEEAFTGFNHGTFMTCDKDRVSNYWLNTLLMHDTDVDTLYEGITHLNAQGIHARPLWTPLHQLPMYKDAPRMPDLSVTEKMAASLINLPSSAFLAH